MITCLQNIHRTITADYKPKTTTGSGTCECNNLQVVLSSIFSLLLAYSLATAHLKL